MLFRPAFSVKLKRRQHSLKWNFVLQAHYLVDLLSEHEHRCVFGMKMVQLVMKAGVGGGDLVLKR